MDLGIQVSVKLNLMAKSQSRHVLAVLLVSCQGGGAAAPDPVATPCRGDLLAAGSAKTWMRDLNGTVWAWGSAAEVGGTGPQPEAQRLELTDAADIALKSDQICVLTSAGDVRCGPFLGDVVLGDIIASGARAVFAGVPISIDGIQQTCVVKLDGAVLCWRSAPLALRAAQAQELTDLGRDVTEIALQTDQGCAIKMDGTAWCWGRGYLGDGVERPAATPARPPQIVPLPAGAVSVASDARSTCFALTDGTVFCFGEFDRGPHRDPFKLAVDDVVHLSAGEGHTCALTRNHEVWCWGTNTSGQMGREPSGAAAAVWMGPGAVTSLGNDVTAVAAGYRHTCALHGDATVSCWGRNDQSQSGAPPSMSRVVTPQTIRGCRSGGT